jgi:hypothetical protein
VSGWTMSLWDMGAAGPQTYPNFFRGSFPGLGRFWLSNTDWANFEKLFPIAI